MLRLVKQTIDELVDVLITENRNMLRVIIRGSRGGCISATLSLTALHEKFKVAPIVFLHISLLPDNHVHVLLNTFHFIINGRLIFY